MRFLKAVNRQPSGRSKPDNPIRRVLSPREIPSAACGRLTAYCGQALTSSVGAGSVQMTDHLRRDVVRKRWGDRMFIAHATPGGRTERFARTVVAWGKPVVTVDAPENAHLVSIGAEPIRPGYSILLSCPT